MEKESDTPCHTGDSMFQLAHNVSFNKSETFHEYDFQIHSYWVSSPSLYYLSGTQTIYARALQSPQCYPAFGKRASPYGFHRSVRKQTMAGGNTSVSLPHSLCALRFLSNRCGSINRPLSRYFKCS